MTRRVLLVSRHDYRTSVRANFHPIADAFRELGDTVSFVSIGFSPASRLSADHRLPLFGRANRWEELAGINCFLWKAPFHPVGLRRPMLDRLALPLYRLFTRLPARALNEAAASADLILVESGLSAALIPRLRRQAPNAALLYVASDLFETIGAPAIMDNLLYEAREAITTVIVVGRAMAPHFRRLQRPIRYVPHGIDPTAFAGDAPSPYTPGRHVVTVGSMLFDPHVFAVAAAAFPDVGFHLIGTPPRTGFPDNVVEHGRMPFSETIRWLKHADAGVAAYRRGPASAYLSDSSMKLMQYGHLGLPAVCPEFAVGDHPLRFGYRAEDEDGIVRAFENALAPMTIRRSSPTLTWTQVAQRLAAPERFADTAVDEMAHALPIRRSQDP